MFRTRTQAESPLLFDVICRLGPLARSLRAGSGAELPRTVTTAVTMTVLLAVTHARTRKLVRVGTIAYFS